MPSTGAGKLVRYWIIVASKDHLQRGLAGGFIQANHGKAAPLKPMHEGDWVIFHSPKLEYEKPGKLQCFTAICKILDENIYQHDMGGGFVPFRRNVKFLPVREALFHSRCPIPESRLSYNSLYDP